MNNNNIMIVTFNDLPSDVQVIILRNYYQELWPISRILNKQIRDYCRYEYLNHEFLNPIMVEEIKYNLKNYNKQIGILDIFLNNESTINLIVKKNNIYYKYLYGNNLILNQNNLILDHNNLILNHEIYHDNESLCELYKIYNIPEYILCNLDNLNENNQDFLEIEKGKKYYETDYFDILDNIYEHYDYNYDDYYSQSHTYRKHYEKYECDLQDNKIYYYDNELSCEIDMFNEDRPCNYMILDLNFIYYILCQRDDKYAKTLLIKIFESYRTNIIEKNIIIEQTNLLLKYLHFNTLVNNVHHNNFNEISQFLHNLPGTYFNIDYNLDKKICNYIFPISN